MNDGGTMYRLKVDKVWEFLQSQPEATSAEIAKATGLNPATARRISRELKEGIIQPTPEPGTFVSELKREAPDLDSFVAECKVNLDTHWVARHLINSFEQGSKNPRSGHISVTRLFQIKIWVEPRKGAAEANIVKDTMNWIRDNSPVSKARTLPAKLATSDEFMLEISIVDLHVGKMAWGEETGDNYTTKIASSLHQQATEALWHRSSVFPIKKVLLLCGNDFFNVNGASNATAAGTPQSEDDRWPKTFREGVAILSRSIEFLRSKVGDVEVRFIRGNHDSERIFLAGEVIGAMYHGVKGVTITNDIRKRQYMQWGCVLLGFSHGDSIKLDKLPLIMAGEAALLWGKTTHREIHVGHFHHKKEIRYVAGNEINDVRLRILPSLTAADVWHSDQGYVGQRRAAESYLWSKKDGYVGHFSWSPQAA